MAVSWEGTYTHQEKVENTIFQYEITIFEMNSKMTAKFTSKSTNEYLLYDCSVVELSESRIELIVSKCLQGNGIIKKDDIIIGLEKSSNEIKTHWGAFSPKNEIIPNSAHFKFDKSRIDHLKKYDGYFPYEVEFFKDKWITQHLKNAMKEKYEGLLAFLKVEEEIKLKENILFIRAESADKKGIGNAGKNIIVIDIKHKTLFVAMIDANQKLITSSSGLGPKPTILTNWINKHS